MRLRGSVVNLNTAHMSPDELKFIRLYCSLLRQQYYDVKTVMTLMRPDELAVSCPVAASALAAKLSVLEQDFSDALEKIRKKNKIKEKRVPHDEVKFLNELADIFALSFFKVVAVDSQTTQQITLIKDGWCSGEPSSWSNAVEITDNTQTAYQKKIMSHILNFFSSITLWKKPSAGYKNIESNEERDEYDEYDEDDDWYKDD